MTKFNTKLIIQDCIRFSLTSKTVCEFLYYDLYHCSLKVCITLTYYHCLVFSDDAYIPTLLKLRRLLSDIVNSDLETISSDKLSLARASPILFLGWITLTKVFARLLGV